MSTVVIYNSKTGFTKRYADWIVEETGADCFEFSKAKKRNFNEYDNIIFGSWCCAGGIQKMNWFKEHLNEWKDKNLFFYVVGASPAYSPDIQAAMETLFADSEWECVKRAYCPGGLDYDKMSVPSRMMMKMFAKSTQSKKEKTEKDEIMGNMISSSYDISDRKYIEPLLEALR